MHTSVWKGESWDGDGLGPKEEIEITMHHNGDYSGSILFSLPTRIAKSEQTPSNTEVWIPFEAIKSLVLQVIRDERISKLEMVEDDDLWSELIK